MYENYYRAHTRRADLLGEFTAAVGEVPLVDAIAVRVLPVHDQGGGSGVPTLTDIRSSQHDVVSGEETIDTSC